MKTLITGATGFVGGSLARTLAKANDQIRVLVRNRNTGAAVALEKLGIEVVQGCIEDSFAVDRATNGCELVYHCAAKASDYGPREEFVAANIDGVRHVINACLKHRVRRLVHVSSTDVYGHPNFAADENTPFQRRGFPYVDTKSEAKNSYGTRSAIADSPPPSYALRLSTDQTVSPS